MKHEPIIITLRPHRPSQTATRIQELQRRALQLTVRERALVAITAVALLTRLVCGDAIVCGLADAFYAIACFVWWLVATIIWIVEVISTGIVCIAVFVGVIRVLAAFVRWRWRCYVRECEARQERIDALARREEAERERREQEERARKQREQLDRVGHFTNLPDVHRFTPIVRHERHESSRTSLEFVAKHVDGWTVKGRFTQERHVSHSDEGEES